MAYGAGVSVGAEPKVDSKGVWLRLQADSFPRMSAADSASLWARMVDVLGLAVVLSDDRFAYVPAGPPTDGQSVHYIDGPEQASDQFRMLGPQKIEPAERPSVVLLRPTSTHRVFPPPGAVRLAANELIVVRELTYSNPWEAIITASISAVAGGGVVGLLNWLTTVRSTRRRESASADKAAAEARLAWSSMPLSIEEHQLLIQQRRAEVKLTEAQAEKVAAEAFQLRAGVVANLSQFEELTIASDGPGRIWGETELAALLDDLRLLSAIEMIPTVRLKVEIVPANTSLKDTQD